MTAWQNQPPLSRRQARDSARLKRGDSEAETNPESTDVDIAAAQAINVAPGKGRRVQWDPSAATAEGASSGEQSAVTVAPTPSHRTRAEAASTPVVEAASAPADDARPDPVVVERDVAPVRRSTFAPVTERTAAPWSPPTGVPLASAVAEPDASAPITTGRSEPVVDLDAPERTMTRRELRNLRERALADGEPEPSVIFGPEGVAVTTSSISIIPRAEQEEAEAQKSPAADTDDTPSTADAVVIEPVADEAGVVTEEPVKPEVAAESEGETDADVIEAEIIDDEVIESEAIHSEISDAEVTDSEVVDAEIVEDPTIVEEPSAPGSPKAGGSPADEAPALISPITRSEGGDMRRPVVPASEALFGDVRTVAGATDTEAADTEAADTEATASEPAASEPAVSEPAEPVVSGAVSPPATPFGHWSTQIDNADPAATGDAALSRNVGVTTGAITTHALVLPSIPESGDQLLAPLTDTGEIMVTGSIDLPRSFGSTGVHPALFDHPDVDALIDDADRDDATAESAPVRAVRAVASNSSARAVIEAPAPRKSRLPLILGIIGGAVLLAAIVVIVTVSVINGV